MKLRDDNIIGRQSGYHKSTGSVWAALGAHNAQNLAAVEWVCLKFTDLAMGLRHL